MYKIYGKILVKETGVGVPNLIVVIYDVDATCETDNLATLAKSHGGPSGDRIGSVLTDTNGNFELAFDDAIFAARDPERRPDLVLGVFAPEDIQSTENRIPLPASQRLLIYSNIPRENAGQTEAYILRIPRALLEQYDIPFRDGPGGPDVKVLASRLVSAEKSSEELKSLIREGLAPLRKARMQRQQEIATASKKFVKKLGAKPLAVREQLNFVGPKRSLASAQRAAMAKGLVAIQNMVHGKPLVYQVTKEDFAAAGIIIGKTLTPSELEAGMISMPVASEYTLTHEQLCRLIGRRRGGVALERVLDLVQAKKEEAEGMRRVKEITQPPEEGVEGDQGEGEQPAAPLTSAEAIRVAVLGQLTDLTAPAAAPAASIDELSARLTGFTLPPGPADVTSLHDFHQLQIAFEHVWTEAFDKTLKDRIQQCYDDVVRLHDDFGEEFELPAELGEIDEITDYLRQAVSHVANADEEPYAIIWHHLPDAAVRWYLFTDIQRADLLSIAREIEALTQPPPTAITAGGSHAEPDELQQANWVRERGEQRARLLAEAEAIMAHPGGRAGRLERLLNETRQQLTEPYAFHYFAPNSVNFGILVTYRQKWEPLIYQVGDLTATIPLAPGESRKFSSKTIIKRTRAQKELEKALSSRSGESSLTIRAEEEITQKASTTTNFKSTAQGSFNIGIGSLEATAEFAMNQAQESASVKKSFREAVIKSAWEYKRERALEIETTQEATVETTNSGEISNTNNEVPVTYLLYELERQYRISERIHRVMPVILVAQDVPGPHEITESWLLAHEWILRRVLLDDGLQPALDQLSEAFAGEELAVHIKRGNWETQKGIVEKLDDTVSGFLAERHRLRQSLLGNEYSAALAKAADDAGGFMMDLAEGLTADLTGVAVDVLEAGVKKIQKQLDFLQESLSQEQQKLAAAQEALDSATKEYTQALESQTNRRVAIDQLRVHVKLNILYYMQAIWDHEPPDQRFFRLYDQDVELPEAASQTCRLRRATAEELARGVETIARDGEFYVIEGCGAPQLPDEDNPNMKKLVEIADIDRPLGYKGNYIIFPLKTCVYLTEFMMKQFVDGYFGVRDPDEASNYTSEELLTYLEAIWDDETITLSKADREALKNLVLNRIREPRRDSDIVVVPSGQLYIEALLGSHSLLEPFKRIHRAYDVGKARAELRRAELDNLRRAARLLKDEPELEDPDIDRRVVVEGTSAGVIVNDA